MSAAPIGWGILGTGTMAGLFAHALRDAGDARLVAVASRETARAADAARRIGAERGATFEPMLAMPEVEVVYIATPHHRHRDDCLAALAAGKHVLCEKPLATSAADAREIAAAARAAGRFCMEGLWTQFIPAVAAAERALAEGAIGEPRLFAASFATPVPYDPAGRLYDPALGGGALLDRGVYPVSLALRLMGPVEQVEALAVPTANGVDAATVAILRHAGGRISQFAVALDSYGANGVTIAGASGRLTLDEPISRPAGFTVEAAPRAGGGGGGGGPGARVKQALRRSRFFRLARSLRGSSHRHVPYEGNGYVHEVREVHACLRAGRLESATVPLDLSIRTIEVLDRVRAAAA